MSKATMWTKAVLLPFAGCAALAAADSAERQLDSVARQLASLATQRQSIETALGQQESLALQRASAARQNSTFFTAAVSPVESAPGCEPLPPLRAGALIEREARRTGLSTDLLNAVIRQESAFRPCAVSAKGAMGLMQLMPETARDLHVEDPFDPDQNVSAGARFLKQLVDRYPGDLNRALGAYNSGAARVDATGGVPPIAETLQYVESILNRISFTTPP